MKWQIATGYGKRSLVETAIGRYKSIIGRRLQARSFAAQQTEGRHRLRRPQSNAGLRTPKNRPVQERCRVARASNTEIRPLGDLCTNASKHSIWLPVRFR
jgi:hypothetical protein